MNVSLLILVGWLSATLAPLPANKVPSPALEPSVPQKVPGREQLPSSKEPTLEGYQPLKPSAKLPKITKAARVSLKPGSYSSESLQLPKVVSMDPYDAWQQGPAWPYVENGVVIVTPNADDPQRFMAFLVDVTNLRIAAIRDGDTSRHFFLIGRMTAQGPAEKPDHDAHGAVPPGIVTLAGSGAVIIIRPPVPPGPTGLPDDFVASLLDVATVMRKTMNLANVDIPTLPGQVGRPARPGEVLQPDKGGFH